MLLNLTQPKSIIPLVKYALGRDAHSITACFGIPHAQPSITNSDKVEFMERVIINLRIHLPSLHSTAGLGTAGTGKIKLACNSIVK